MSTQLAHRACLSDVHKIMAIRFKVRADSKGQIIKASAKLWGYVLYSAQVLTKGRGHWRNGGLRALCFNFHIMQTDIYKL